MTRAKVYTPRNYAYGSYYVMLRDREREILRFALTQADGNSVLAAGALGISERHLQGRAVLLGGVIAGQPRIEPPSPPARTERYQKAKNAKRDHSATSPERITSPANRSTSSAGRTPSRDGATRSSLSDGDS